MSKVYIIHHDADNDGLLSAYIAQKALLEIDFEVVLIGYDYGRSLDEIKSIPRRSLVYMLDISLPLEDMVELAIFNQLTWIDHHKKTYDEAFDRLKDLCIIKYGTMAACRLTWRYFYPNQTEPKFVELVGRYDVFDGFGSNDWETEILPFEYAVRGAVSKVSDFAAIEKAPVLRLYHEGVCILGYLQSQVNKESKFANLIEWRGHKTLLSIGGGDGAMWYNTPRYAQEQPDLLAFA